ncbi:alpha-amylase family glycosyl hydrolase [Marinicauda algicola]|nr:alpha-amylase family glycosyl hydrolase [Marinicauda algicola]
MIDPRWTSLMAGLALAACSADEEQARTLADAAPPHTPEPYVQVTHPEWTRDAVIYQINTRQFTREGTFAAAAGELPRLAGLGVDILWLMPVQPIGEVNRKGPLGSPYSIADYTGVNPELGTLDELKAFIDEAHALGMHVILDWVANHTAWDNPLVAEHPEWYSRNWAGEMQPPPGTDWSDVVDLDYSHAGLREYMSDAMAFWVREVGFDGFRADVAGFVPLDFWEDVRAELDAIKPVFMLAEWETRDLHAHAFDATYAWSWWNRMHDIAQGRADAGAIRGWYFYDHHNTWPEDGYRMVFVSNHDKNAWEATQFEAFGEMLEAAIVLSVTGEGLPMIYNGQEAGNTDRLAFFERDPIQWREHPIGDLYRSLFALKEETSALWNGSAGAKMVDVPNSAPARVLSFVRRNMEGGVFVVLNLSGEAREVTFGTGPHHGAYTDRFSGERLEVGATTALALEPWGWRVLVLDTPGE